MEQLPCIGIWRNHQNLDLRQGQTSQKVRVQYNPTPYRYLVYRNMSCCLTRQTYLSPLPIYIHVAYISSTWKKKINGRCKSKGRR